jgi:hypothetical protein
MRGLVGQWLLLLLLLLQVGGGVGVLVARGAAPGGWKKKTMRANCRQWFQVQE